MSELISGLSRLMSGFIKYLRYCITSHNNKKVQFAQFFANCNVHELKFLQKWSSNENCFLLVPDDLFEMYYNDTVIYKHVDEPLFQFDDDENCRINPSIYKVFQKEWKKYGANRLKGVK